MAERRDNDLLIRDAIVVFAHTGMRLQELAHLMPKCIQWRKDVSIINIYAHDGWSPKDKKEERIVPMFPEVEEIIRRRCKECKSDSSLLFRNKLGGALHASHHREQLQALFPAAGIDPKRKLHWHSFRNYFIILCLKKGMNVYTIMKIVGHDSTAMVLHYADAMKQVDVIEEFKKAC